MRTAPQALVACGDLFATNAQIRLTIYCFHYQGYNIKVNIKVIIKAIKVGIHMVTMYACMVIKVINEGYQVGIHKIIMVIKVIYLQLRINHNSEHVLQKASV